MTKNQKAKTRKAFIEIVAMAYRVSIRKNQYVGSIGMMKKAIDDPGMWLDEYLNSSPWDAETYDRHNWNWTKLIKDIHKEAIKYL